MRAFVYERKLSEAAAIRRCLNARAVAWRRRAGPVEYLAEGQRLSTR